MKADGEMLLIVSSRVRGGPECGTEKLMVSPSTLSQAAGQVPLTIAPPESPPLLSRGGGVGGGVARRGKVWMVLYRETSLVYKPSSPPYGTTARIDGEIRMVRLIYFFIFLSLFMPLKRTK